MPAPVRPTHALAPRQQCSHRFSTDRYGKIPRSFAPFCTLSHFSALFRPRAKYRLVYCLIQKQRRIHKLFLIVYFNLQEPLMTSTFSILDRFFRTLSFSLAGLLLSAAAFAATAAPRVEMQTTLGKITLELDAAKAPKSVENFLQYARSGQYDGTIFHRVIDGFMIQGGGFTKEMNEKPTKAPIANEAKNGLKNLRGSIAMARRADPHSATAQFFINHRDNPNLDYPAHDGWGYAVFGKVTEGMDVVDKIAKVKTGNRGMHQNVPVEPVIIESVKVLSDK